MTSVNVGYIIALEAGSPIIEYVNWSWIIFLNGILTFIMGVVLYFCLNPDPISEGYVIDEFNDRDKKLIKLLRKVKNNQLNSDPCTPNKQQ